MRVWDAMVQNVLDVVVGTTFRKDFPLLPSSNVCADFGVSAAVLTGLCYVAVELLIDGLSSHSEAISASVVDMMGVGGE